MPNIRMTPFPGQKQPSMLEQILQRLGLTAANVINPQMRQQVAQQKNPFGEIAQQGIAALNPFNVMAQSQGGQPPIPPAQARNPFTLKTAMRDIFTPSSPYAPSQEQMNKFFPKPVNEQTALGLPSIIPLQDYAQTVQGAKAMKAKYKMEDMESKQNNKSKFIQYVKGIKELRAQTMAAILSNSNLSPIEKQQLIENENKKTQEDLQQANELGIKDFMLSQDEVHRITGYVPKKEIIVPETAPIKETITTQKKVVPVVTSPEVFDKPEKAMSWLKKNGYDITSNHIEKVPTENGMRYFIRPQYGMMEKYKTPNEIKEIKKKYEDVAEQIKKDESAITTKTAKELGMASTLQLMDIRNLDAKLKQLGIQTNTTKLIKLQNEIKTGTTDKKDKTSINSDIATLNSTLKSMEDKWGELKDLNKQDTYDTLVSQRDYLLGLLTSKQPSQYKGVSIKLRPDTLKAVKGAFKRGISKDAIRNKLIKQGYDAVEADAYLNSL